MIEEPSISNLGVPDIEYRLCSTVLHWAVQHDSYDLVVAIIERLQAANF